MTLSRPKLAALLLGQLAVLGGCADGRHDPVELERCLERNVSNYVRTDTLRARPRPPWLVARLGPAAAEVAPRAMVFEPLDPTFGEKIDGVITAPAAAAFVFLDTAEVAKHYERQADARRANLLVVFARNPTDRQQDAIDGCLRQQ